MPHMQLSDDIDYLPESGSGARRFANPYVALWSAVLECALMDASSRQQGGTDIDRCSARHWLADPAMRQHRNLILEMVDIHPSWFEPGLVPILRERWATADAARLARAPVVWRAAGTIGRPRGNNARPVIGPDG